MGHVRVAIQNDKVTKEQNVKTLDGKAFVYTDYSRIDMKNVNFFYGGRGNGFTNEVTADFTMGEKKTSLTDDMKAISNYKAENNSKYFEYSFGTSGKTGASLIIADYKNDMFSAGSVNGMAFDNNKTVKSRMYGGRIGKAYGTDMFSLGMHLEVDSLSSKGNLPLSSNVQKIFAFGLGGGGKRTHLEVGVEFDPFEKGRSANGDTTPMKISLILETKIGHVSLGYKGAGYRGSFIDVDKLVQSQLVYLNQSEDTRVEHTFNFALSSDKGCTVGFMGMYSSSSANEYSSIFNSKETHQTKSKSYSLATKIGYSW